MNPFLKEFGATSNENLHLRIMQEPELKEAYQSYETSLNDYHESLLNAPALTNSAKMKSFFTEHNFCALNEPTLVLFNPSYKPLGKVNLDISNKNWLTPDVASSVIRTPYVAAAVLHVPFPDSDKHYVQSKALEKQLATVDISLLDTIISTNKEVISLTEDGVSSWSLAHDSDLPLRDFIQPEIFEKRSTYLTGYHEFKQFVAERKINGLHINNDAAKIKSILIDTYKTQPYETANMICYNKEGFVNGMERISAGTTTRASVYPVEVAKKVIKHDAHAFSLVHNHPSGIAEPSDADIALTKHMQLVADMVARPIIDHKIVASNEICSFVELEIMNEYRGFEDPELER